MIALKFESVPVCQTSAIESDIRGAMEHKCTIPTQYSHVLNNVFGITRAHLCAVMLICTIGDLYCPLTDLFMIHTNEINGENQDCLPIFPQNIEKKSGLSNEFFL